MKPLLPLDLTRDCMHRLKTIGGQLDGLVQQLRSGTDPEMILMQFKAVEAGMEKVHHLLLDEVYRKALAIQIAEMAEACPGNCGNEELVEIMRKQFPNLGAGDLAGKFTEVARLKDRIDAIGNL